MRLLKKEDRITTIKKSLECEWVVLYLIRSTWKRTVGGEGGKGLKYREASQQERFTRYCHWLAPRWHLYTPPHFLLPPLAACEIWATTIARSRDTLCPKIHLLIAITQAVFSSIPDTAPSNGVVWDGNCLPAAMNQTRGILLPGTSCLLYCQAGFAFAALLPPFLRSVKEVSSSRLQVTVRSSSSGKWDTLSLNCCIIQTPSWKQQTQDVFEMFIWLVP